MFQRSLLNEGIATFNIFIYHLQAGFTSVASSFYVLLKTSVKTSILLI